VGCKAVEYTEIVQDILGGREQAPGSRTTVIRGFLVNNSADDTAPGKLIGERQPNWTCANNEYIDHLGFCHRAVFPFEWSLPDRYSFLLEILLLRKKCSIL
jgi:hypothetical protein